MKLKILVKIIEKVFGITYNGEECRADMYLPDRLLAMSLVYFAGAVGFGIYASFDFEIWAVVIATFCLILGVFSLLCWKNQTIYIDSDEQFTYTTMFGKKHTYNFSDIQGLRLNKDSQTLFVANKKVHIESMAILSDRLVELINNALLMKRPVYFCRHIIEDGEPILYIEHDLDGDFQFLCGKDHSEEVPTIISFCEALEIDPSVRRVLDLDMGQCAVRENINDDWKIPQ